MREQGSQDCAQPDHFEVQAQQNCSSLDRDRMVGEGEADLRVEQ